MCHVKKTIWMILMAICLIGLTACMQVAPELVLPQLDDIEYVDVINGEEMAIHTESEWIKAIVEGLLASKPTSKPSIQDSPLFDEYVQIDFHLQDGVNTLYVYKEDQRHYAERPYQGIYEIDSNLYDLICQPE